MEVTNKDHTRHQGAALSDWWQLVLADIKSQEEGVLWKKQDNVARMLISISVDEAHVEMLINCQTTKHMWSRLAIVHEQSSRENVHLLQGEFFSYKM